MIATLLACGGCQPPLPPPDRYTPSPETGRQALEEALTMWREGRARAGAVHGAKVEVVDSHRKAGQRLQRFAILGETPGDATRCFAVRLWFDEPKEELRARYVVVGIDPLWVYRHEDYLMMIHWMCGGDNTAAPPATDSPAVPNTPPASAKPPAPKATGGTKQ
jgi:hypothetical protein